MLPRIPSLLAAGVLFLSATVAATAQDNAALIDLLVRKGFITEQEADDVRSDLAKENAASTVSAKKANYLERVTVTGRIQAQYAGLSTDVENTDLDPADISHFFLRRVYLGAKAELMGGWSGTIVYDFVGSSFDAAFIEWKNREELFVDVGLRRVPIGFDEWQTSSGKLKTIERSAVTRYFVEPNNGRRLGAGAHRVGVFAGGQQENGFNYMAAITNPERPDSAEAAGSPGSASNNNFAYWGYAGYSRKTSNGSYWFGASAGLLPDQGGKTVGAGDDLFVTGLFGDFNYGPVSLTAEYYWSNNEHGASATEDANSWGYYIMPTYRIGSQYELVFRYGYVDSDGRGISLSDGIRSGPSGGTMDTLTEYYLGANWFIRGWDLVLQGGYVFGETRDNLDGSPAKATVQGVRAQMQLNF